MKWHTSTMILVGVVFAVGCDQEVREPGKRTVLARVLENQSIQAAYAHYEPLCLQDDNGLLIGVGVEILEEVGKRLDLEIVWAEETGWGLLFEGLQTDRFDVFGVGVWRNGSRGRAAVFSSPFLFNAIKVWGAPGQNTFNTPQDINSKSVKISTQDGGMGDLIAKSDFPYAHHVSLPELSPFTDLLFNVTTGKADVVFAEPSAVHAFLRTNPGALEEYFPHDPLRVFPTCFAFKMGAFGLKEMFDSAIMEMHNDGTIETILAKHEKTPDEFYRVAKPYRMPSTTCGDTGGRR